MQELSVNAYAKINLTLDILGTRPDGYHEVQMLMQSVALADCIQLSKAEKISLTCTEPNLPTDAGNLIVRSALLLQEKYGVQVGATISLAKNIPVAAGLAGGSADAAATLAALNYLWDLRLTVGELVSIAAELGSDIPFCLIGGTALAQGRGERLTILPRLPRTWLVLVKPNFGVSTKEIYAKWDERGVKSLKPCSGQAVGAVQSGNWAELFELLNNQLEEVTINLFPEVKKIKQHLLQAGATKALMSGSGPTVYGIMRGQTDAERAAASLRQMYSQVFVTYTL